MGPMDTSMLNAFITKIETPTGAPGPLGGMPFAVKDLIATAGVRTTAGSAILKDWVPRRSAPVVRALRAAGGRMVGKTNTHEFAFGTTNDNPHFGATRNPWNLSLTTGGSSGGSAAAVAAGVVPLALGTDTAGSIRIPAALCGCVGFKPSWGAISNKGVVPLAPSLDTVGFLSATVADSARAWSAVTSLDTRHLAPQADLNGLRIGLIEDYVFDRVDDEIVRSVQEALRMMEKRGAHVRRVAKGMFADCGSIGLRIVRSEALAFHRRWFPSRRADYGPDVARSLDAAAELTAQDYLGAMDERRRLARAARALFADIDVLAGPTTPIAAFPNSDAYEPVGPEGELPRFALTRLTYPFSLSRLPAISVPCGLTSKGLPIGLQLAGGFRKDEHLLQVASAYEEGRGPFPHPPVFSQAR
jgi:aspartyl-tRNA(Asn)/glutamyl-tRNA(Gln) amidotransferase subunit A